MKCRTGFVSNSSSSSFIIWGASLTGYGSNISKEDLELMLIQSGVSEDDLEDGLAEYIESLDVDLDVEYDYDSGVFIGISPKRMKDDETFAEFKKRVETEVAKIHRDLPSMLNFGWQEECYYNG